MAFSPDDIKARYPLPAYNFKVEINGEIISFSEVSGLSKSFETVVYKESKTDQPGSGPDNHVYAGTAQANGNYHAERIRSEQKICRSSITGSTAYALTR
jgi:hypothetical protein